MLIISCYFFNVVENFDPVNIQDTGQDLGGGGEHNTFDMQNQQWQFGHAKSTLWLTTNYKVRE